MKGLLIKDLKLLTKQKTALFIVLAFILFFPALEMDPGFIVGYTMIVLMFMTIGTVSYDEFDNGMSFLLTLPVGRKTYVREKYIIGLTSAVVGWGFAVAVNLAYYFGVMDASARAEMSDYLISLAIIFPLEIVLWEILLPMQLKFGAEKSRIVLVIIAGAATAVAFVGRRNMSQQQVERMNAMLATVTPSQVGIALFAVAIAGLLISYIASVRIVEKKEY